MQPVEVELIEEDFDDSTAFTTMELGWSIDLAREDLDDEDDLGFRALYEHPEALKASEAASRVAP